MTARHATTAELFLAAIPFWLQPTSEAATIKKFRIDSGERKRVPSLIHSVAIEFLAWPTSQLLLSQSYKKRHRRCYAISTKLLVEIRGADVEEFSTNLLSQLAKQAIPVLKTQKRTYINAANV
jgi:hypothetical protein